MKKILGLAEGFSGSYLVGWAIALEDAANCCVEIFDRAGKRVGSGRAARQRDDLTRLGLGRTNCGFSIPIKKLFGFDTLRAVVDGYELPGSPLKVGPGIFDGELRISGGIASGSVTERCSKPALSPLITITSQDGEVVGQGTAEEADSPGEDPLYAPRQFEIPLSNACYGQSELFLTAFANRCKFYQLETSLRLSGNIDILTPDEVHGWLLCPDAPKKKLALTLWADGQLLGRSVCDLRRDDLKALYPECTNAGFHLKRSNVGVPRDDLSEITLRLEGSYMDLFGGPFIAGGRVAQIRAAKKIANIVNRLDAELAVGERSLMQDILREFLRSRRASDDYTRINKIPAASTSNSFRRINILIPIYKGVEVTRECIDSVLADRSANVDSVVLIADSPPEPEMMLMLARYRGRENVFLLENKTNLGFVGAVNRGLNFCRSGDVLLLNSDTKLCKGALDELWTILHSLGDIATATALSNNATVFSYPHPGLATRSLDDIAWGDLAEVAMRSNKGKAIEVPTGHGFCLLVRREVLDRLGNLSTEFGRGYGEENEFCARATDLGYKHVAATAVLVEHVEAVSFGAEKDKLVQANLMKLGSMFPEYAATIMAYEGRDDLRAARWPLDEFRLNRARTGGMRFVLVVENWLDGGVVQAVNDIEEHVGYQARKKLRLACTEGGLIELESKDLRLRSVFSRSDYPTLFSLLDVADIDLVVVHQLLGFDETFISALGEWSKDRRAIYFAHDFYALCARVNLIDPVDSYCRVAEEQVCERCIKFGGAHAASRLNLLKPKEHRELFRNFLNSMASIITPSKDTQRHLAKIFHSSKISVVPHPEVPVRLAKPRLREIHQIALLGAIGPHKGSKKLVEVAAQALLSHPHLTFYVIGYTDIDDQLMALPNVKISGRYKKADLGRQIEISRASIALFLHVWPETFSYTFSEALEHSLVPVVPDIGAPAERVRELGIGSIYPFPIRPVEVLDAIEALLSSPNLNGQIDAKAALDGTRSVALLRQHFSLVGSGAESETPQKVENRDKRTRRRRGAKRAAAPTVAY